MTRSVATSRAREWITVSTGPGTKQGMARWGEIARYEPPIRGYLTRYRGIDEQERDELLQEVLLAMHEKIIPAYRMERGPFRRLLQTAIGRAVASWFRSRTTRRGRPLSEPDERMDAATLTLDALEVSEADVAAIDFEASVGGAVRKVHDAFLAGSERQIEAVRCYFEQLVHGLAPGAIAERVGLTAQEVKDRLKEVRRAVMEEMLREPLERAGLMDPPAPTRRRAADRLRAVLRAPRNALALLAEEPSSAVRAAVLAVADDVDRLRERAREPGAVCGEELRRILPEIFDL